MVRSTIIIALCAVIVGVFQVIGYKRIKSGLDWYVTKCENFLSWSSNLKQRILSFSSNLKQNIKDRIEEIIKEKPGNKPRD